jgi:hypothetical protein
MLLLGPFQDTKTSKFSQVPRFTNPSLCLKDKILELQLEKTLPYQTCLLAPENPCHFLLYSQTPKYAYE